MLTSDTRRERKKRELRHRIVECAAELFAAQGYEATTMEDIGDCADVARATVFNHFPRKEDVVLAWFDERRERLAAVIAAPGEMRDATAQLREAFDALVRIFESEPAHGRGMVRAWLMVGGPLLSNDSATSAIFATAIAAGQRDGSFAAHVDAKLAGRLLFDAYQGELIRWAVAERAPADLQGPLLDILEIVLRGIVVAEGHDPATTAARATS